MTSVTFIVFGPPLPKPRPRVTRRGTFMPAAYTAWRERVRDEAGVVFAELEDRGTPWDADAPSYAVGCSFYLAHGNAGDVDNLLGGVLDALNKFAWPDDRLVSDVFRLVRRVDALEPRVEVELRVGGVVDGWTAADEARSRRAMDRALKREAGMP